MWDNKKRERKEKNETHSKKKSPACCQDFYFQAGLLALLASKPNSAGCGTARSYFAACTAFNATSKKACLLPAHNTTRFPASGCRTATVCIHRLSIQKHKARSSSDLLLPWTRLCSRWQKLCLTSSYSCRCQLSWPGARRIINSTISSWHAIHLKPFSINMF